jgi:hypothetical protein
LAFVLLARGFFGTLVFGAFDFVVIGSQPPTPWVLDPDHSARSVSLLAGATHFRLPLVSGDIRLRESDC